MPRSRTYRSPAEIERGRQTGLLFEELGDAADVLTRKLLLDEVVVLNLPVARHIAWGYRGRGCQLEDLEQTAALALVKAAGDFDPVRGTSFLGYAVPCMTGSVKKHFRDYGWMVRPPRMIQELHQQLRSYAGTDPSTGRPFTSAELASRLSVAEAAVEEARGLRGCFTPTSLDTWSHNGTEGPEGLMPPARDEAVSAVEARILLRPALASLSEEDRWLLLMRFVEERSQNQMADELDTTQASISRRLIRVLGELRGLLAEGDETDDSLAS